MRQVILSIETTGKDIFSNSIVEIGGVEILDGNLSETMYHQYINPKRKVDEEALARHGLSEEFLKDKPVFEQIADELISFLKEDEIVTSNKEFLLGFLNSELDTRSINNNVVDILELSKKRHPKQNKTLKQLSEKYYINTTKNELTGALYTSEIIAKLLMALNDENTVKITSDTSYYRDGENLTIVENFSEFDRAIEKISKSALCRGVSNHEYPLLPSLFRNPGVDSAIVREKNMMWIFKTHAKALLKSIPNNELEWLVIAQHHGLPTRLLDWSLSPLVACFFAVQSLSSSDAAVYVYDIGKFSKEEDIVLSNLYKILAFFPSHTARRVSAQLGMFTIHPSDKMQLESELIHKIIIKASDKKYFLEKLVKFGIHHGTMFPDLDGLSNYLKYQNDFR